MFIVITGPSASGKSTFAACLSHELGIPAFTKDDMKIALSRHITHHSPNELRRMLSKATSSAMFSAAESMLAANVPFILEANFRQYECDHINDIILRHGCKCLTYLFTGDLNTLARRFIEREQTSRHTSLRLPNFNADQAFYAKEFEEFVNIRISSSMIQVDSTCFASINFNNLIESARKFMKCCTRHPGLAPGSH